MARQYQINPYAAGEKVYGLGRTMPTMGPVDPLGYRERDLATQTRRNALLRLLKANAKKNYMNSDWLRNKG